MKDINLEIVKFCAEECARQRVTDPLKVWHYVEAWHDALHTLDNRRRGDPLGYQELTHEMVWRWGSRVERDKNLPTQYRGYFAGVHRFDSPPPQEVEARMDRWLDLVNGKHVSPQEAYKEFEVIHPLKDGNGRVGKIIYNWLKGTLDSPVMPPNFFGEGPA
jgi:hypothetical protein